MDQAKFKAIQCVGRLLRDGYELVEGNANHYDKMVQFEDKNRGRVCSSEDRSLGVKSCTITESFYVTGPFDRDGTYHESFNTGYPNFGHEFSSRIIVGKNTLFKDRLPEEAIKIIIKAAGERLWDPLSTFHNFVANDLAPVIQNMRYINTGNPHYNRAREKFGIHVRSRMSKDDAKILFQYLFPKKSKLQTWPAAQLYVKLAQMTLPRDELIKEGQRLSSMFHTGSPKTPLFWVYAELCDRLPQNDVLRVAASYQLQAIQYDERDIFDNLFFASYLKLAKRLKSDFMIREAEKLLDRSIEQNLGD